MPFYLFNQNNSGGSFIVNDKVAHYVFIEANKARHANTDAEFIGIYFGGVDDGEDCDCCGDRWCSVDEDDATDLPKIYGEVVDKDTATSTIIYYADGTVWRSKDIMERFGDKK